MQQYIGLLETMSITLPQIKMYWSKETKVPCIANVTSINRFPHCNDKHLQATDKDFDKLYKVRPFINYSLEESTQIPQEEHHSVDELIFSTKSQTSLRQYRCNKPNNRGIKVWARCGVSGILFDFEIYTGRTDKAQASPAVASLDCGHICFWNFYSTVPVDMLR